MVKKKDSVEETMEPQDVDIEEITELQEGGDDFRSYGYSYVKVTQNGKVKAVKLPIMSSGVTELIEDYKEREPQPPLQDVLVKKDSEMGKNLKLAENKWMKVPNLGDPEYVKKLNKYESELGIAILQKGLKVKLKDKEGNVVIDDGKKIDILKSMGMSGPQFTQVVQDIRAMTEWTEQEMLDFFGMSSATE